MLLFTKRFRIFSVLSVFVTFCLSNFFSRKASNYLWDFVGEKFALNTDDRD